MGSISEPTGSNPQKPLIRQYAMPSSWPKARHILDPSFKGSPPSEPIVQKTLTGILRHQDPKNRQRSIIDRLYEIAAGRGKPK